MTAHKLLYYSRPRPDGSYMFIPRGHLEFDYKMIIVDEISMLPKKMWELLLSHKIYVVACGDPSQLSPIRKDSDNHVLDEPHIFLDEIMRQAEESEIIRLSMWVREGKPISEFPAQSDEVKILTPEEVNDSVYLWADQIICATNKRRREINQIVHKLHGLSKDNLAGSKLVCLRNQWDFLDKTNQEPLVNGTTGILDYYHVKNVRFPHNITDKKIKYMYSVFTSDDGYKYETIPMEYKQVISGKSDITDRMRYLMNKSKKSEDAPFEFDLGYCLSCWKAQGSQWNKVLLFEEAFPYDEEEHRRYLYTGITRAIDKVVIVTDK